MKSSLGVSNFLEEISSLSHCIVFLFLCRDHWGRLSYLSLLFSGTLHSNGYIFPFLLCLLLLFFSQLFVRPPQTAVLLFCISFFFFALLYLYSCKVISLQLKKKQKNKKNRSSSHAGDERAMDLIPGLGRSPGGGNRRHSSILAGIISWTEEPGKLQSMGSQRVRHSWKAKHAHMLWME